MGAMYRRLLDCMWRYLQATAVDLPLSFFTAVVSKLLMTEGGRTTVAIMKNGLYDKLISMKLQTFLLVYQHWISMTFCV